MIEITYYNNGNKFTMNLTIEQAKNELRAFGYSRAELATMKNETVIKEIRDLYLCCSK